jgi:hypothetical protein
MWEFVENLKFLLESQTGRSIYLDIPKNSVKCLAVMLSWQSNLAEHSEIYSRNDLLKCSDGCL